MLGTKGSSIKFAPCLLFVMIAPLSFATADDLSAAAECARIGDSQLRLSCYDDLFRDSSADGRDRGVAADPAETASAQPDPKVDPEAANIAGLGAEQLRQPPVESVEARLIDDFTGWTGRTVFRLDNGQVWQQTRNYIRDYKPPRPIPQAKVTISKGLMGSYNLQVEGVRRIVQVKRVE
jgi:hypothetical protein